MLEVILSAVAVFIFGAVWFTLLVGNTWARLMKFTPEQNAKMKSQGMARPMIVNFVVNLIVAYAIFLLFPRLLVFSYSDLLQVIFIIWLGFSFPMYANQALWEGKSWKLVILNSIYSFLFFAIAGTVMYYLR